MARDFEDIHDIDDLSDDELRELVITHLSADKALDVADIDVQVEDGVVRLEGRVGTEGEKRIAGRIVSDQLGVRQVENELLIDPIRRAQNPEAIDDELVVEGEVEGRLLGDRPVPIEPSPEHRSRALEDEVQAEGTTDVQQSIANAAPWIPPERPTPEGMEGEEAGPEDMGERH